jgi:hypothetical protein
MHIIVVVKFLTNMERKTRFPYLLIDLSLHIIGLCGITNIKASMQVFLLEIIEKLI